jgi:hypothetical protein
VVTQFYATLYVKHETKTMYWTLQGKPLSVSYERFAQLLGFGLEDLGRDKIHGGDISHDGEMAFMYDRAFGNVEFGTTHGMKPLYKMLNNLLRYIMSPKMGGNYNISNIANNFLVRMAPAQEDFTVFDFIWEEIIVCSTSTNKSCQYAPWIFHMIYKVHTVYKPNKGAIDRLLKLGKHAPQKPPPSEGPSLARPSSFEGPSSS